MGKLVVKKSVRPVANEARRLGFQMDFTNNGHIKIHKPGRKTVFCPSTPSDGRGIKNTISQLRRSDKGLL